MYDRLYIYKKQDNKFEVVHVVGVVLVNNSE